MNDLHGQNPLLLLARTCQNIGVDTKLEMQVHALESPTAKILDDFKIQTHSDHSSEMSSEESSHRSHTRQQLSGYHNFHEHSPSIRIPPQLPVISKSHNFTDLPAAEKKELKVAPSSNALLHLARLSSSLALQSERKEKFRHFNLKPYRSQETQRRRYRRLTTAKFNSSLKTEFPPKSPIVIDYSVQIAAPKHNSSDSVSPVSASISPSSLRSASPIHQAFFGPQSSGGPDLTNTSSILSNWFNTFFTVGTILGVPPSRLQDLLVSVANALIHPSQQEHLDHVQTPLNGRNHLPMTPCGSMPKFHEYSQSMPRCCAENASPPLKSDELNTQCLYCGMGCESINQLVQHIYSHIALLHRKFKVHDSKLSPAFSSFISSIDHKLIEKYNNESAPLNDSQMPFKAQKMNVNDAATGTDPKETFYAWLSMFRSLLLNNDSKKCSTSPTSIADH